MNEYKKYNKAIEELPLLEKQIQKIYKIKEGVLNNNAPAELCLRIKSNKKGETYEEKEKEKYSYSLSYMFTRAISDIPEQEYDLTDFTRIHEKIAINLCDMMLQNLIEKRKLIISLIKNLERV